MKALVINQDSQTQRMTFQTQQLRALGVDFQRVSTFPIDGTEDPIYKKYYNTWQRPMSIAEVSCLLSHKSAWEIIVANNEPMLVLEDDAWLDDNTPSTLAALSKLSNIDYARLEVVRQNRKQLIGTEITNTFDGVNLHRLYQGRSGSAAYVLWPSAAKQLLTVAAKGNIGLADKFINTVLLTLNAYQVEPGLVIQLDQCAFHGITPPLEMKSTISNKTGLALTPVEYIRYKLRRILGEIKVGMNLLSHKHHAERRAVTLSENFKQQASKL